MFVYGRKYSVEHAAATRSATASVVAATTVAVGWCRAISRARLGPDTTATRSGWTPATSATTSLIRRFVPSSTPLDRLTSSVSCRSDAVSGPSVSRSTLDGRARTSTSAEVTAAAASVVERSPTGRSTPGR